MTFAASMFAILCHGILLKNGSQNDAKIDAEIIKNRFWAAKGATNVDLEYFLAVF